MKFTTNSILTILASFVVVAGAYWYFSSGEEQPSLTVGVERTQTQIRFQTLVGELQPISFSTDIFFDPRFNALVDITVPVSPEQVGRLDPFAPVTSINGK